MSRKKSTDFLHTSTVSPGRWFTEPYVNEAAKPGMIREKTLLRFRPPGWKAPAALTISADMSREDAEHIAKIHNEWLKTQKKGKPK
jgi:hypothetical protein